VNSLSECAEYYPPMFSTSAANYVFDLLFVPFKAIFYKRYEVPVVERSSFLDPALTYTPIFANLPFIYSEHTVIPFVRVVELKGLTYLSGSGISPNGRSPKLSLTGSFEN